MGTQLNVVGGDEARAAILLGLVPVGVVLLVDNLSRVSMAKWLPRERTLTTEPLENESSSGDEA